MYMSSYVIFFTCQATLLQNNPPKSPGRVSKNSQRQKNSGLSNDDYIDSNLNLRPKIIFRLKIPLQNKPRVFQYRCNLRTS